MEKCSQNQQYVDNNKSIANSGAMQGPSIEQPSVKKFGREASPVDMEAEQTNFMEKAAGNNRKRKLSEDSDYHKDDLPPIRRCVDISSSITRDLEEMKKSVNLLMALDFSLYGLSATKPVVNKDTPVNADTICQVISKTIDFHQDILDQISCISSKQMKALNEELLSKDLSKQIFIKNIDQMISHLNMLIDLIKKIPTSDTNRETNSSVLTDVLEGLSFLMI